jgi:O-antigen/teichoic acid export membrane protein
LKPTRLRNPSFRNLLVLGTGEVATRGLTFLAFAYLARALETSEFGLIGSTLAVMMMCMLVIDQGLGVLGAREIAREPDVTGDLVDRVVTIQLGLAACVFGLVLIATWILPLDPVFAGLLRGFGLGLLPVPFLLHWVFQGRNEMFWFAAPMVLRQGIFLCAAVLLVGISANVSLLPFAEVAAVSTAGLCYIALYWRLGQRIRIRPRSGWDFRLLRDTLPIGGSQIIWAVRMYLPILIVLGTIDSEAAGRFEAAHRLVMVFQALLGVYFTNLLPALSLTSYESGQRLIRLLRRSTHLVAWPTVLLGVAVLLLAPLLLRIVFGQPYVTPDSVRALVVMTWIVPVLALRRISHSTLIVLNLQRPDFYCSIVGLVSLVALIVPLTRAWGIEGTAWAMVLSEAASAVLAWVVLVPRLRQLGERGAPHLRAG